MNFEEIYKLLKRSLNIMLIIILVCNYVSIHHELHEDKMFRCIGCNFCSEGIIWEPFFEQGIVLAMST